MSIVEGHPIPQDITGFQFRLIGDMTVKQFAYLAAGALIGWLLFSSKLFFIVKVPIAALFAITGVVFAFVPIQGRPADTMILLFFKALFKPNEYAYDDSKKGAKQTTVTAVLPMDKVLNSKDIKEKETTFLDTSAIPHDPLPMPQVDPLSVPVSTPNVQPTNPMPNDNKTQGELEEKDQELTQKAQTLSHEISELEQEKKEKSEQPNATDINDALKKVKELENQLQTVLSQKQDLEKQVVQMQQKTSTNTQPVYTPSVATPPAPKPVQQTDRVKQVPDPLKKTTGVPLVPDVPNLIAGVIKDPRGNVLAGILVEVKDKDDNPVRAFRTNQLGQFASATPLLNGTYTVTFEDPKKLQSFDTVEITADGNILSPLEVTSIDAREQLRQSLFTQNT